MRIAHLAFDQKFIPFAQSVFEDAFPGGNTWLVLREESEPLRFISDLANVRFFARRRLLSSDCLEAANGVDLLVVHAMIPPFAGVVKRVARDVTVLWFGWGYEYYSFLERAFGDPVLPETAAAWRRAQAAERSSSSMSFRLKNLLRPPYRALKAALGDASSGETIQTVAGRIDLCSVSPSEMPFLEASFPDFRAKHYQLHYFSTEDTLDIGPAFMAGPDILLGNSDTPENNHFEAMNLLRRMDIQGRKIIAPLSYGHTHYGDEVCRAGFTLFGSNFVPLRDYVSVEEYHQRLATCGTVVMNHRRQAAMGSISAALYKGARVILREENPIFQTYTSLGAVLDSMRTIERAPRQAVLPLSEHERALNRRIVGEYLSRPALISAIRALQAYCRRLSSSGSPLLEPRGHE